MSQSFAVTRERDHGPAKKSGRIGGSGLEVYEYPAIAQPIQREDSEGI
jgi:hypothetical protein